MSGSDRRLAAIMFTDIVGYTRMAQANESQALELLEEHRKILRPLFPAHGGTEVKTMGDAFLVEFRSALEAVLCAVEIQKKISERNTSAPKLKRLDVRVGIHLGDVVHGSGDVYGDAVNVASRIEPLAEPGGICISQQVYDHVRNKTELDISRMGQIDLKNVELPLGVYRINMPETGERRGERAAPRERLAVLPFVNISPDPNDEYFADGLTEELISKLSEIKGLKVIARTSVMNYKKKEKNISEIGKELDVGTIIEGSIRKAGTKIRVAVQLIDSRTEEHLWASSYDKELDDIFAIQSDVAAKVAESVSKGFFSGGKRSDTKDIEAYTLYLKAMQLQHEGSEPGLREAVVLFEKAIARDGGFARAYAGLASTFQSLVSAGYDDFAMVTSRSEPAARRALELDPGLAEAHSAMSGVANMLDRFDQAISEGNEAVRINPNLAEAHLYIGIMHASNGRIVEGIASCERAHELDPLSIRVAGVLTLICRATGRVDRSLEVLNRMDELYPKNPRILNGLAESYMFKQDLVKAQELLTEGLRLNPSEPIMRLNQGLLYAFTGKRKEAEKVMDEIVHDSTESARLYSQLFINAALGNLDEAFKAADRMTETHSWPFMIGSLPVFAELRKDSRYLDFSAKVGLPT
ncbi:MAG: tetratricopeptide repeat protein [Thaumarchaeota archaeon]|nr:tetratricopeptide repeat protein [Nitrososphaerota archaeon]